MPGLVDLSILDCRPVSTVTDHLVVDPAVVGFVLAEMDPAHLVDGVLSGKDVHFISSGKWSLYDLLIALLPFCSPAVLYLSTYSLTEFSARILARNVSEGHLSAVHILLDKRAKVRYPEVYQLAGNISNRIRLMEVHAKVMVLQSADRIVTVVGSANWTENPRIEAGILTTNPEVGNFHKMWLDKAIEHGTVFK